MTNENRDAELEFEERERLAGHGHGHIHEHIHGHIHEQIHEHIAPKWHGSTRHGPGRKAETIVTIRSHTGLSGDMLLTGLALLNLEKLDLSPQSQDGQGWLANLLDRIKPGLGESVKIESARVGAIQGWRAKVSLPDEHEHRNLDDIVKIIAQGNMEEWARERAIACFELLAQCEADAHGLAVKAVHFHEVGALDSILDICGVCELLAALGRPEIICGPLPLADGQISCAHGLLPAPAPAVLRLLRGVQIKSFAGDGQAGELVTPTAIALLKVLHATFGKWPHFRMDYHALVYGRKVFENAPNGVIFAMGEAFAPTWQSEEHP